MQVVSIAEAGQQVLAGELEDDRCRERSDDQPPEVELACILQRFLDDLTRRPFAGLRPVVLAEIDRTREWLVEIGVLDVA